MSVIKAETGLQELQIKWAHIARSTQDFVKPGFSLGFDALHDIDDISNALSELTKEPNNTLALKIANTLVDQFESKRIIGWNAARVKETSKKHKITSEKYYRLAHSDALTGKGNRLNLETQFEKLKKDGEFKKRKYALVMLDLDKFKSINDTYGHEAGDEILREAANILDGVYRHDESGNSPKNDRRTGRSKRDYAFAPSSTTRLGGDEFVLLIPADEQGLNAFLERLEEAFKNKYSDYDNVIIPILTSFGATEIKQDDDLQSALNRADKELYRHKGSKIGRSNAHMRALEEMPELQGRTFATLNDTRGDEELAKALTEIAKDRNASLSIIVNDLTDSLRKHIATVQKQAPHVQFNGSEPR